jgi:hypothetical protein
MRNVATLQYIFNGPYTKTVATVLKLRQNSALLRMGPRQQNPNSAPQEMATYGLVFFVFVEFVPSGSKNKTEETAGRFVSSHI